jgi:hypothetical protein
MSVEVLYNQLTQMSRSVVAIKGEEVHLALSPSVCGAM